MFPTLLHQVRTTLFRDVPKPLGRSSVSVVNYWSCDSQKEIKEMIDSLIDLKKKEQETN